MVFEIFGYDGENILSDQSDRIILTDVNSEGFNIIDFNHDWFSNYAKAKISFRTSPRVTGRISMQFRYYGSSDSNFKFLFFSRCVKGIESTNFDHNLFNVSEISFNDRILNLKPLDLNNKRITNIQNGVEFSDAANIGQVLFSKNYLSQSNIEFSYENNRVDFSYVTIASDVSLDSVIRKHNHSRIYTVNPQSYETEGNNTFITNFSFISNSITRFFSFNTIVFEYFTEKGQPYNYTKREGKLRNVVSRDGSANILRVDHSYDGEVNKGLIKFTSNYIGNSIIDFELLFENYNIGGTKILFYYKSFCGDHIDIDFNHNILVPDRFSLSLSSIDMDNKRIIGLPEPVLDSAASNKKYIDDISSLKADKTYVDDISTRKADRTEVLLRNGSQTMTGNLSMDNNRIFSLPIPTGPQQPVTKTYLESQIATIPKPDLSLYLKVDGSVSMTGSLQMGGNAITGIRSSSADDAALTVGGAKSTYLPLLGDRGMEGDLDMGGNSIINIKPFVEDDSSQAAQNAQSNYVINFGYFHGQRGDLKREINDVSAAALNRKSPDPMEDSIDMANHSIIRLKDPKSSDSFHASNVNYVNRTISDNNTVINSLIEDKVSEAEALNIKANRQDNEFSFVMDDDLFKEDDDDIVKVRKVDKDYYDINKATYQFKIKYDSAIGYYSTQLTIDLKSLDLGEYTLAFEMYYGNLVDRNEVVVDAVSETLNVSRNNTNTFSDHSRTIINFHKYGNVGIIDLDIDLTLKYKSGATYDAETVIFVVVYGVSGHQNDVDPRIWDRFYTIRNKIVYYEAPINMGNRQIKGLIDGNENGDAVNVKQLNETEDNMVKYVDGEIVKVNNEIAKENPAINENKNFLELIVKYILSNDSKISLIKDLYFSDSNEGRTPNTYAFVTTGDNTGDFTFYYVFQHSAITNNVMAVHFDIKNTRGVFIFVDKSKVVISRNPT